MIRHWKKPKSNSTNFELLSETICNFEKMESISTTNNHESFLIYYNPFLDIISYSWLTIYLKVLTYCWKYFLSSANLLRVEGSEVLFNFSLITYNFLTALFKLAVAALIFIWCYSMLPLFWKNYCSKYLHASKQALLNCSLNKKLKYVIIIMHI